MARGERFVMDLLEPSTDPTVILRGALTVSLAKAILDIIFCSRPDFLGVWESGESKLSLEVNCGGPSARKAISSLVLVENPRSLGDPIDFNSPIPSSSEPAMISSSSSDSRLYGIVRPRGGREEVLRSSSCGGILLLDIEPVDERRSDRMEFDSDGVYLLKVMPDGSGDGSVVMEVARTRGREGAE